jgi:hypothetical protein
MSTAFFCSDEVRLPPALAPLRSHAAVIRALLDEFERLAPLAARSGDAAVFTSLGGQLAEEVGRLGCRMLECAAALTGTSSNQPAGQRGSGRARDPCAARHGPDSTAPAGDGWPNAQP